MNYNELYRASFCDIAPLSDNDTIIRNVKERAEDMSKEKRTKRNTGAVAAIAAAAVLAAATITVGAATGWDFNSAFGEIFGKSSESSAVQSTGESVTASSESDTAPTETADTFDFMAYGKQLDMWYDLDGYSLNLKGISADSTTAYLLYDVVFDEGYDCAPLEEWTDWELVVIMDALKYGETEAPITRVHRSHCELISQRDNVLSFYGMMSLSDITETLQGMTVTLDFCELYRMIPSDSEKDPEPWKDREQLSCDVQAEIVIDFPVCSEAREITLDKEFSFHKYNADMQVVSVPAVAQYFRATPFSWELFVELDTSDFEKGDGYGVDLLLHLKDGTVIDCSRDYSSSHSSDGTYYRSVFSEPVDIDEIEYVEVTEKLYH